MEKSHTVFLQDFRTELEQLKGRIQELESRLEELEHNLAAADETPEEDMPSEEETVDFTGVEIGIPEEPETAVEAAPFIQDEGKNLQEEDPSSPPAPQNDKAMAPQEDKAEAPQKDKAAPIPIDEETARLPWRTDKPGLPVKNIRSGISLLDRALFIGTLFKEDFALYDRTISHLNECGSLEEAVHYIREQFPQWNMRSDVVYHFMMAIRKKLG